MRGLDEVSEQDDVEIVVANIVNPASFLSGSTGEPVIHECLETIEATYSSRQDLKDTPLEDAETCLLMEADNLIPSHGEMSCSSFEWIDQPDSGAGPV
ncbi:hypothetical protein DUI87_34921 [Hirundo rustica rustica]|uniref:Uncharacterized protein n=1 Tax=Hirundo rustica rustica TaxID=333673 RepID=A0A3M0IGQ0_HIRRU|nr:hypothetical protein DUI87_34921 [Hirundo rustica rustica]